MLIERTQNTGRQTGMTSIIILTFNQIHYTQKCLESILHHTRNPYELILVDNGSSDGTDNYLESLAKNNHRNIRIHFIKNEKNLGFAAGNNQGIAAARGEYILLLNNDTMVTAGWLKRLIACAEDHPKAGMIGPVSNYVSGPQLVTQVDYDSQTAKGLGKFAKRFAKTHAQQAQQILRVVGFCMLIKGAVIEKIGGLDDRFGLGNFEDDDFSLRAAIAGFESWIARDCFVHHFGHRTFAGAKINFKASLENNWRIFKEKWGLPATLPYKAGYRIGDLDSKMFDPVKYYIPLPGWQNKTSSPEDGQTASEDLLTTLEKARNQSYGGKLDQAVKTLLKGAKLFNKDKRIFYCLVEILINERRYSQAIDILEKLSPQKNKLKKLELMGYCKAALNQDYEAEIYANRMLDIRSDHASALYLKGRLALKQRLVTEAEDFFLRALNADEKFGPAYTGFGQIKKEKGLAGEALDLMEKGFILAPTQNEVLVAYHREARAQKAFERAQHVFNNLLAAYPGHKLIHFQVIDLLLQQEKFEAAMAEIEKAMAAFGVDNAMLAAALNVKNRLDVFNEIQKPDRKRGTLSICLIVKNEEAHIAKCLSNLKPLADEIIVVDTGSSDRTKKIAGIFGARVYDFEWQDDFAAARNHSLSKATCDWILVMDADEIISPADFPVLKKIIKAKKPKAKAFSFVTRNYQIRTDIIAIRLNKGEYEDEEAGYGWIPSKKVRLFKNGLHIRFEYPVHEAVEPFLNRHHIKIGPCAIPIHHYGKLNNVSAHQKGEAYFELGLKKLEKSPDNAKAIFELAIQAGSLKKYAEAIELWQRFNTLSPNNPIAYTNMGAAYAGLKEIDQAIATTKTAMELAPDMPDAFSNYALFHIYKGEADVALPILQKIENKYPDYHSACFKLAVAHACLGRPEEALRILKELKKTALGPGLGNFYHTIVTELISFGQSRYATAMRELGATALEDSKPQSQSRSGPKNQPEILSGAYDQPAAWKAYVVQKPIVHEYVQRR